MDDMLDHYVHFCFYKKTAKEKKMTTTRNSRWLNSLWRLLPLMLWPWRGYEQVFSNVASRLHWTKGLMKVHMQQVEWKKIKQEGYPSFLIKGVMSPFVSLQWESQRLWFSRESLTLWHVLSVKLWHITAFTVCMDYWTPALFLTFTVVLRSTEFSFFFFF